MKRILSLILAAMMLLALAACSNDGGDTPDNGTTAAANNGTTAPDGTSENPGSTTKAAPVFVHNGTTIKMNEPAAAIIAALGEPLSKYDQPSCAFQGNDYVYNYGSFELTTYDNNGDIERVYSVFIKDDLVTTPEGLYIGSPEADAAAIYGADSRTDNGNFIYAAEGVTVTVIIKDGKVTSIEYVATFNNN